jgi:hypothetical protein
MKCGQQFVTFLNLKYILYLQMWNDTNTFSRITAVIHHCIFTFINQNYILNPLNTPLT